jgi:hypothetical protein
MGVALDIIKKIDVVEYYWNDTDVKDIGIIAEELAKIVPEAVWYKDGQIEGIKPLTMIGILVKAVQELEKEYGNK